MKAIKQASTKAFAVLMAAVLALGLAFAGLAASGSTKSAFAEGETGSITISNATIGQSYNVYKIFDATYSTTTNSDDTTTTNVSYTATAAQKTFYEGKEGNPFVFTENTTGSYNVSIGKDSDGNTFTDAAVIAFLQGFYTSTTDQDGNTTITLNSDFAAVVTASTAQTATSNTVKFDNLSYGYYLVTSSLGAVVTIDSAIPEVTVIDKNTQNPSNPDKDIVDGDSKDATTADVGDTVNYSVTFTAVNYVTEEGATTSTLVENYVVKDTPTNLDLQTTGLTVIVLEKGATEAKTLALTTDYTVSKDETSGVITVTIPWAKDTDDDDKLDTSIYKAPATVTITYSAIVTGAAATTDTANNSVTLYYNNNTQVGTDTTNVKLFEFTVNKVDSSNASLTCAEFELYKDVNGTKSKINLVAVYDTDNTTVLYYRPATTAEASVEGFTSAVIEAGKIAIKGLDDDTYYLRETKAPSGYNLLTEDVKIVISTDNDGAETVAVGTGTATTNTTIDVVNESGTELPSTGGIGTTIFYIIGGILVVGAAVLLITKRRMKSHNE